jgi:hypothetical protein
LGGIKRVVRLYTDNKKGTKLYIRNIPVQSQPHFSISAKSRESQPSQPSFNKSHSFNKHHKKIPRYWWPYGSSYPFPFILSIDIQPTRQSALTPTSGKTGKRFRDTLFKELLDVAGTPSFFKGALKFLDTVCCPPGGG